jgi:toxin ParE1/3/4
VNGPEFILSPCVESELGAIWARIATVDPDAATRAIELAYETFATLAREPGSGRLRKFHGSRLKDIRSWHITGLDNYLVFYRPVPEGIQVLHVWHGARDVEALFGDSVVFLKVAGAHSPIAPTAAMNNHFEFLQPVVRQSF